MSLLKMSGKNSNGLKPGSEREHVWYRNYNNIKYMRRTAFALEPLLGMLQVYWLGALHPVCASLGHILTHDTSRGM